MNTKKCTYTALISGGGTGGHIFPAIAIAQALQKQCNGINIHFVGALGKMEMDKVPQAGFGITGLPISGFDRSTLWKNVLLPFKLLKSILLSYSIIKKFNPTIIIGVGGYASGPLLWVGQQLGITTVIQEQNAFAGKTNQYIGKKAKRAYVAFDRMHAFFPHAIIKHFGNPVRESLLQPLPSQYDAKLALGFDPKHKLILVTGGSLGALAINEAVLNQIEMLLEANRQVFWQTGIHFYERNKSNLPQNKQCKTVPFIANMQLAFAAADLVVCRAGASTLSELANVQKPAILIPLPSAAEDHQTINAQRFVEAGAALLISNNAAKEQLISAIISLVNDQARLEIMQTAMGKLALPKAAENIAKDLIDLMAETKGVLNE